MAPDIPPKSSALGPHPYNTPPAESALIAAAQASPGVLEHAYEPAEVSFDKYPIKRPVLLGIEIIHPSGGTVGTTRGLVDSGADFTTLPSEWALELGINLDECVSEKIKVIGPSAVSHRVYTDGLTIRVLGEDMFLPVVKFADGIGFICLGRNDFFDRYAVLVDHRNLRFFTERLPNPVDDEDDDPQLSAAVSG